MPALFDTFIKEIKFENRNPKSARVLDLLSEKVTNPEIRLGVGVSLFRCRIIKSGDTTSIGKDSASGFWGFDKAGSFVPPSKSVRDMRANYRYIPYLYVSLYPIVAISETRPRFGAEVSIATISPTEDLHILDFSNIAGMRLPKKYASKIRLFNDISRCFSLPVTDEDDTIDYIPTQFIAEYVKNIGYDGIAYESSVRPGEGVNFCIFNYRKCEVLKSNVLTVDGIDYRCNQMDNDVSRLRLL